MTESATSPQPAFNMPLKVEYGSIYAESFNAVLIHSLLLHMPKIAQRKKRTHRTAKAEQNSGYLEVGERLRLARLARGLKMHQVAKAVGCSVSLISKYESEVVMPSLSTLHKIVGVLGTNISALFNPPDSTTGIVSRARDRRIMKIEGRPKSACFSLEMLISHQPGRQLQAMIYVVPPNAGNPEPVRHEGEETGYVLEGMLELIVDGRSYLLAAGDAFAFSSQRAHHFRNPGQVTTRILWVNTPPTF